MQLDAAFASVQQSLKESGKTIEKMISDSEYYNSEKLKELLGEFYNANASTKLPVVSNSIATRFLGLSEPGFSSIIDNFNAKMKRNPTMYEIWESPSGMYYYVTTL